MVCDLFAHLSHLRNAQRFKRLFAPTRMDRSNFVEIDDERILYATPGISETKFSWNAVVEFAQDEKVTLLYVSKRVFITMPRRLFSRAARRTERPVSSSFAKGREMITKRIIACLDVHGGRVVKACSLSIWWTQAIRPRRLRGTLARRRRNCATRHYSDS